MPSITIGMSTSGQFTFSGGGANGAITQRRGSGATLVFSFAPTSGTLTFPSGAVIQSIPINAGASGQTWPNNQPSAQGSANPPRWFAPNPPGTVSGTVSYSYSVIVSYNGQTYTGDPEIVTQPPGGGTFEDPGIISTPPGTKP